MSGFLSSRDLPALRLDERHCVAFQKHHAAADAVGRRVDVNGMENTLNRVAHLTERISPSVDNDPLSVGCSGALLRLSVGG
jgi:hypothetical protein